MVLNHPLSGADNLAVDHDYNAEGDDNQLAVVR
jgi:hypothetical protein